MPPSQDHLLFYIGQEVEHVRNGRGYLIEGVTTTGVDVVRNLTGLPEDDESEKFPFDEIRLILKPLDSDSARRYMNYLRFIKYKADQGYWVFDQDEIGKSIIPRN